MTITINTRNLALLAFICLGSLLSVTASAQICQPCSAGGEYKIIVGPLDPAVSVTAVTVGVTNMSTGVTTNQVTTSPVTGPGGNWEHFPSFPGGPYGISTVTIQTSLGTIYEVYCTGDGTYACYPVGNPAKWLKISFKKPNCGDYPEPDCPACWVITIESTQGPC